MAAAIARTLMGVVLCALVLAGATSPAGAESVLRRGNGGEPTTLDPHRTDGRIESNILRDLFEGLVTAGADGRVIGGVAESWDVSDDGLRYTFKLRGDAGWSNGDAITSADIVYSFRRAVAAEIGRDAGIGIAIIDKAEEIIGGKAPIDQLGVAATDPTTVVITLRNPAPYFLALLSADNKALPVHRATVEKYGNDWAVAGRLIGNGAYRLVEWVPGKQISLLRNTNFHHVGQVGIDRVIYYPISNPIEEQKLFQAGELDTTVEVAQQQVKWVSLTQPAEFWNRPQLGTYYYALNLMAEPFRGNLKLRQALTMAVNREALVNKVTRAGEAPAYGFVPPTVPGYRQQTMAFAGQPQEQNVVRARRLFAEAGYGPSNPLRIEVLFNASENNQAVADGVLSMWREAFGNGIVVTAVSTERGEYFKRRANRDFQVVRAAWFGDYGDPTVFLSLLRSSARPPRNDAGYKSAKFDELLAKAAANNDVAERADLLQQAEKAMLEDVPLIPLYHFATKSLVSQRIKGWVFNIRDVHPTRFLWVEK